MNMYDLEDVYTRNNEEMHFNFNISLRASDKVKFVKFVTNSLVDEDYNYILKDMIFDFGIIYVFTDVDVSHILSDECEDSLGMIEDMLDETNIVEIVKMNAELGLIEELRQAVDYNIEYKTGIHRSVIAESLGSLLDTIEEKIFNIDTDGMMEMAKVMSGMSGELTADKILEAYSKSDMYKNQYKQLVEKQEKHNAKSDKFKVVKSDKNESSSPVLSPDYEV